MALSEHGAEQASPVTAPVPIASTGSVTDPGAPAHLMERGSTAPAGGRGRRMPRRLAVALVAGVSIALFGVLPASAGWPVASRSSYVSQYSHRGHVAIDIAASRWTRLVPIRSGRVIFAGWKSNCGGYQVWVSHGNGLYSAYYHMARETSYRGEWVTGGSETIGYVGTTGCVTGSHLHIEVWRGYPWRSGSSRVNPWAYLDGGYYLPYRYR